MYNIILIRYGEIHLKGKNRPYFERMLKKTLSDAVGFDQSARVWFNDGRYYVEDFADTNLDAIIHKTSTVFGVHSICPALKCQKEIVDIAAAVFRLIELKNLTSGTFKIEARRSDKRFYLNSMQLAAELGGRVLSRYPELKVDVVQPDHVIYVEVRTSNAYVYYDIIKGPGGMPLGTSGSAMLLLSGGIDSPVAGYMMAKRGLGIKAVHFFSFPYTSERAKRKVIQLAQEMSDYCGSIELYMVPFTQIQEQIYENCNKEYMTIIMRRFMMRIAEKLARQNGCDALITGESLGQVASQTLLSLNATNSAVDILVLRPLIGTDKADIMDTARSIGTYETSILPYEDCCTVFVPKHPATRPDLQDVVINESILNIDDLIGEAIIKTERIICSRVV